MSGRPARKKMIELRQGKPRRQIAEKVGITPQGLGMIERGERMPRPALAKRIAELYGVTIDELFFADQ